MHWALISFQSLLPKLQKQLWHTRTESTVNSPMEATETEATMVQAVGAIKVLEQQDQVESHHLDRVLAMGRTTSGRRRLLVTTVERKVIWQVSVQTRMMIRHPMFNQLIRRRRFHFKHPHLQQILEVQECREHSVKTVEQER